MARAAYNENDPFCAAWLRNATFYDEIADGKVIEGSIEDLLPSDLDGFNQVHLFAGIGVWSVALRMAGWSDDKSVWTCSCPCQPFSQAGEGKGFADERHLWPAAYWLISQHRPDTIFGEQVTSPDGRTWLDLVSTDLEAIGYAFGAADIPSAGVGAPNERQRHYWVAQRMADAELSVGWPQHVDREDVCNRRDARRSKAHGQPGTRGEVCGMAESEVEQSHGTRHTRRGRREPSDGGDAVGLAESNSNGRPARLASTEAAGYGCAVEPDGRGRGFVGLGDTGIAGLPHAQSQAVQRARRRFEGRTASEPSGAFNPWCEPEWLDCRDGKLRPTQRGLFPLAPRNPGDTGRLRAYGNAINPWVAAQFISAHMNWLLHRECDGL